MTNSHSSNRHYREEFEGESRFRLNRAFLIVLLIIVVTVTHYLALLAGAYLKGQECRAAIAAATSTLPVCPVLAANNRPLTQWTCDAQEFKEHASTCVKRGFQVPSWYRYIKPPRE